MNNIILYPIEYKSLKIIIDNINKENKFVHFSSNDDINGIYVDNQLVGIFTLNDFIDNTIAIHFTIFKEFRNRKYGRNVLNEIVMQYGENYSDNKYFVVNIDIENQKMINLLNKTDWIKTYEYDDLMEEEGAEFFIIYKKKNPYYIRKVLTYDKK